MKQREFVYPCVCGICGEPIEISWQASSLLPYICEDCAWEWHGAITVHYWKSADGVKHFWLDQEDGDDDTST